MKEGGGFLRAFNEAFRGSVKEAFCPRFSESQSRGDAEWWVTFQHQPPCVVKREECTTHVFKECRLEVLNSVDEKTRTGRRRIATLIN